ncbi:methionine--tRNA ligase [Leptospira borgpetersenii]|uniref:Methionine--tRNA ligase n=3 Tax=Leptospira borgpetersenii serovar Hardjo-bovis TaxID=338217 RepID=SYM_LEPBJ|nr:methionine--tRNA ligase [Leptospira borgpetersenii]Q04Q66.1 RecName: Full=Methionine--tRNA ligase; AltName: Full=Methionyl-tRNA synthetase; Short=MetRS [Leptospira borgpetersenii serovar Hardjo-bovis str. JB197]Q054R6.1 RecName: Full=Methionine--tRNA ligase; AltName: Full=Methionyl-tRNA synthetase; Short=MetRS [Leptospira borgpetersenii serovar Hardjo-bovis str. L550]ABJ76954.1 Methionine tRNA ligase [Leptospira borgpetersenii serovar Hardjo-bovis str. JB197]ABJ78179.1 Methionine tRNA ligase
MNSSSIQRKILVTSALPYANGPIHLGHVLEGIQTDIWVRFQKAIGNECYFFCADDTHGTPVMLAARKEKITPEQLIERVGQEHYTDLTSFGINYDNYDSTHSKANQEISKDIYLKLKEKGHISKRSIEQAYCEKDRMFLPDRFIKGTCPNCNSKNQYGDNCEVCGATYNPKDLIDSHCTLCGTPPVVKNSDHIFFKLGNFHKKTEQSNVDFDLQSWIETSEAVSESEGVKKKLKEWFDAGLQDWDISRDGPYFGFEIPSEKNKYFYVWLDAPVGYMASSKNFFEKNFPNEPNKFDSFWKDKNSEIVHFIGKDILYFHTLFWPAMLEGSGYRSPSKIHVHGFIGVNGEKMSKSRGTFIKAKTFAKFLDAEHLRFYLAAKLGPGMDDIDLSFDDFVNKVNADLVGNLINSVSRVSTTILDTLDRTLGTVSEEGLALLEEILTQPVKTGTRDDSIQNIIKTAYEQRNYAKVMREITRLGDRVNRYVNDNAPWKLIKENPEKAREIVTAVLNASRFLAIYLYPVVPKISEQIYKLLNLKGSPEFKDLDKSRILEKTKINPYEMITKRVDEKAIKVMLEENKQSEHPKKEEIPKSSNKEEGIEISIEELSKVELRVGEIVEAKPVEGADKLVNVKVDLGELGIKNVFAGIKIAYQPENLKGLKVVVVANLKPRKMKFGISEAMLLASGEGESLSLFVPHKDAKPGDRLK